MEVVPAKTALAALYGTESSGVRNYAIPKGKWSVVLLIRGEIHDLLASETPGGVAKTAYQLRLDILDFLATKAAKATSNPIRFNYPHHDAVGTDREYEGVIVKFNFDDDAGIGSGLDFPSWPYYMEFRVAKTIAPLS